MLLFQNQFADSLLVFLACGILSLLVAAIYRVLIGASDPGTEKMQRVSEQIRTGSMTFLRREWYVMTGFCMVIIGLLYLFIDTTWDGAVRGEWAKPYTVMSFVFGALCSTAAGYAGMRTATLANVRTAQAARKGLGQALRIAFMSGAVAGLSVTGLGLIGIAVSLLYLVHMEATSVAVSLHILTGFGFGASSVALFSRIGGGIFTKASDMGADLVGKIETNIPEDDPRNPAVIADNVGDNVGDVAGMSADLFESFVGALLAAMIIGEASSRFTATRLEAVLFPLFIAAIGCMAGIIGTLLVRTKRNDESGIRRALHQGTLTSSGLMIIGAYVFCKELLPVQMGVFFALLTGLLTGLIIGLLTEFATSDRYAPVRNLAESATSGPAVIIMNGLALGYASAFAPVLFICIAVIVAFSQAGLYGIAISAVGMLSTLSMTLAADAYGPVADNAGGIAEMTKMPKSVRKRTDTLDATGNTTAAIGKGFAIGSAALTALALLAAFGEKAGIEGVDIMQPTVLIGLLLGASLPFLFSAMIMSSVGRAAFVVIEEVRRQFKDIKGLMQGKAECDSDRCIGLATDTALREMALPSLLAVCSPIVIGLALGAEALAALLAGALATGTLLAISMANSGGAWDNAKKHIEAKSAREADERTRAAAVIADTVGDPLKDAAGPSINILIKLMAIVSLLTAGMYF